MRTFCVQQSKACCGIINIIVTHDSLLSTFLQLGKAHQVMQFLISNWTADGLSSHMNTAISMIEQIAKLQRKTGNNVITVHGM